jgi:hypothetical protein
LSASAGHPNLPESLLFFPRFQRLATLVVKDSMPVL